MLVKVYGIRCHFCIDANLVFLDTGSGFIAEIVCC